MVPEKAIPNPAVKPLPSVAGTRRKRRALEMNLRLLMAMAAVVTIGLFVSELFMFAYGALLAATWPHIFQADWPFIGPNAEAALTRARAFDALLGAAFGTCLAFAARLAKPRWPQFRSFALAAGIVLYALLNAQGSQTYRAALLGTPLPWAVGVFIGVGFSLRLGRSWLRHEA